VNHAVLALSAAYILDYKPIPAIQARANYHYKQAVDLVDQALRNPKSHEVGKDDAIIAALIMLLSNDVSCLVRLFFGQINLHSPPRS
jgi:hypothetical protein